MVYGPLANLALSALLAAEIMVFRTTILGLLTWPSLITIIEVGVILLLYRRPEVRNLVGVGQPEKRTLTFTIMNCVSFVLLIGPFSVYFLIGNGRQLPTIAQFSIVAVTATLGGLMLTAANLAKDVQERLKLIRVSQKLIVATLLFMMSTVFILMVDLSGGIDVTSLASNLRDPLAWSRGLFFWLAAPSFYVGVFLFLWGLRDLVLALSGIARTSKQSE